jgi:hypothetical protein
MKKLALALALLSSPAQATGFDWMAECISMAYANPQLQIQFGVAPVDACQMVWEHRDDPRIHQQFMLLTQQLLVVKTLRDMAR